MHQIHHVDMVAAVTMVALSFHCCRRCHDANINNWRVLAALALVAWPLYYSASA